MPAYLHISAQYGGPYVETMYHIVSLPALRFPVIETMWYIVSTYVLSPLLRGYDSGKAERSGSCKVTKNSGKNARKP